MSNQWLFIIGFGVCLFVLALYRRWITHRILRRLYALREQKDEHAYMQTLEGLDVRVYFSSFTRMMLRLGYYLANSDSVQVNALYDQSAVQTHSEKNQIAFYSRVLPYFLEHHEETRANACVEKLHALLAKRKESSYVRLHQEITQLEGIYLLHDLSWIDRVKKMLDQPLDEESRCILLFRLAKLYMLKQDEQTSRSLLREALSHTNDTRTQKRLQYLLCHIQELC